MPFLTRRRSALPQEHGQGLTEYALILILAAIVVIGTLAVLGTSIETAYCKIVSQFPGTENPCAVDVVIITRADYESGLLHIDATSDGDYHPTVTLTVSVGGVMEERDHHYHLHDSLPCYPCEVTVTSSAGGSASVFVGS